MHIHRDASSSIDDMFVSLNHQFSHCSLFVWKQNREKEENKNFAIGASLYSWLFYMNIIEKKPPVVLEKSNKKNQNKMKSTTFLKRLWLAAQAKLSAQGHKQTSPEVVK